jgi:glycosyltransferase involved in cell wall biosynthesis
LIGLIARLDPMKDHPTFLRAAALLTRQLPGARFICVGDGPANYRERLRNLSRELGLSQCLTWAGARSDMSAIYNALDIIVSASSYEGFSNVIAEAMTCGVPAVVTDVGDSALIVTDCGEVVPKEDAEQLKEAMARMLERLDKGGHDAARTRQHILDCFSVPLLLHNTESALSRFGEQQPTGLCESNINAL